MTVTPEDHGPWPDGEPSDDIRAKQLADIERMYREDLYLDAHAEPAFWRTAKRIDMPYGYQAYMKAAERREETRGEARVPQRPADHEMEAGG